MKTKKIAISILLVLAMVLGLLAVMPFTASAAAINAVWWTDASANTDFTASIDTAWVSSSGWYKLKKYNEASEKYVLVQGGYGCGYVGTNTLLDFETAIRQNGSGKYKVTIETKSGTTYESAEKTYTFEGALDAPQDLRWYGETALWDSVEGADNYYVCLYYKNEGDTSFKPWSSASLQSSKSSCDFTGQLSNPGSYYFTVEASSEDEMLVSSSAKSPEKTVSYTYSDLNAHWGDVSMDQRKYTLYWNNAPDATGYYMVLSKKNGEQYQPVSGFENRLKKITGLDLYAVMEANGEGDYKVDFFAFNTSPTIRVSNEVSIEITFTNCEHSYTKEIQESYYLHSASSDCTANTEYYYACEHCGEMAPKEAQYVYEGDIGEHDMSAGYQADGKIHWLACSKCDYAHYQNHTLDANNYCSVCDTTVYGVWLGDIQVTSKNCDDITGDGSAFYIPEQNRLFLTNYTDPHTRRVGTPITEPDTDNEYIAMIYAENGLNLHLRGENFLYEDEDWGMQCAVYVKAGDLTVTGTGSLYVSSTRGFYTADGDIFLNLSGSIELYSGYVFKHVDHNIYINNGTIIGHSHNGNMFSQAPVLDDYRCYYAEVSENYNMSNAVPYDPSDPSANVRYFHIEPAYTVTIEPFECEGDYITEVLRYGTEYELPACPYTAPAGKTFYKWGVTPPGNMYEAGVKITITENVELMPLWQAIAPDSLTATYSGTILAGNKITPENISITLTYNDSSTQPVNAGNVEYWYNGAKIEDPVNYVFGAELIGNVNITVKYEGLEATMAVRVVGHEITFNANGGTGDMAKAQYVGEYTLPDCTFGAPTGEQFKGWATSADGEVIADTTYNVTESIEFFAIWEKVATTLITSIEISDFVFPTAGQTGNDWEFSPESLTFGGNYGIDGLGLDKYTGTEWVTISDDSTVIQAGVKYRFTMEIVPQDGYRFPDDMTSDDVTFNGDKAILLSVNPTGSANIAVEFYYEASSSTTPITSISVSGADLPEVGETADDMEFTPTSLTYGGAYQMIGTSIEKYTGTNWVFYSGSDDDVIEAGVRYRLILTLMPTGTDAFAELLTSDDVTFNGKDAEFLGFVNAGTAKYAQIALEFSYEAPATDYGITIADKDDSGATVGVLITEENCADVLGDGTVSYDPTANTLTLNNYVYNGVGADDGDIGYYGLVADIPAEGLTIVLVGTNSITVSGSESAGMIFFGSGDLIIKGNGSLSINSGMFGITVQTDSGKLTIENAKFNITTTGARAIGVQANDFVMNSGNLKITASMIGIGTSEEEGIHINGGSVEIGTAIGGYAFIYRDSAHSTFNPVKPDLSNYVGDYNMTAGASADGTDAVDYNASDIATYKYIKLEPVHTHAAGTEIKSDANNHWNECECGEKLNVSAHADGTGDGKCDTCNYQMTPVAPDPEPTPDPDPDDTTPPADDKNDDNGGKKKLSGGAIAGIVIGSTAGVCVVSVGIFSLIWFVIKKKSFSDLLMVFRK